MSSYSKYPVVEYLGQQYRVDQDGDLLTIDGGEWTYVADGDDWTDQDWTAVGSAAVAAEAMALKVFDQLVIVDGANSTSAARRSNRAGDDDPILLGVCQYRDKSRIRSISFLIGWFLDTSTLP